MKSIKIYDDKGNIVKEMKIDEHATEVLVFIDGYKIKLTY